MCRVTTIDLVTRFDACMIAFLDTELSTSDDDACKTLNEVKVVKSRHIDDFDEINGRHTTYYKRCVSTCPICIRAAYAQQIKSILQQLEWHPQHQN